MKSLSILGLLFISFLCSKAQTWQVVTEVTSCDISSMIEYNGDLYIAGRYNGGVCQTNGCTSNISKFDGSLWSCVGSLQEARVNKMIEYNGEIYAGGYFVLNDGTEANVIKFQSGNWVAVKTNWNFNPIDMCIFQGELYELEKKSGSDTILINKWDGVAWDTVLYLYPVVYQVQLFAMEVYHNELYLGGDFQNICGITANNIIRYDGVNYHDVGGIGTPVCFSQVNDFYVFNDTLYMSGNFGDVCGVPANKVAMWDGAGWSALGDGLERTDERGAAPIYHRNNDLIVSDYYLDSAQTSSNRIQQWDGASWTVISPKNYCGIHSMIEFNNELYAGGCFGSIGMDVLMKLNLSIGIEENDIVSAHLLIFPNPVLKELNIQVKDFNLKNAMVNIFNLKGQGMLSYNIDATGGLSDKKFDMSSLAPGMYVMEIRNNKEVIHSKFVKE